MVSLTTLKVPSSQLFSLRLKTALATGGSRGISAAIALALGDAGAWVCILQRDMFKTETAETIRAIRGSNTNSSVRPDTETTSATIVNCPAGR
ncbi:hypothetical protein FVEN_g13154 [Fusarium venenatum]|uniref:Ketoreductase (KR) domain-containing protein n=1 Tax=Fusarium venenatum TaxID=56646 RepID=A0A2L2T818_9HYPO|nr:uncharacterized protein FVRRES_05777 [Fusarium venenatum]KAG8356260.1 hypothetical protein FVEN_g13154 [Fusarium venenatum]CEI61341.1 unnamed protein product [Fusarium venenatum]